MQRFGLFVILYFITNVTHAISVSTYRIYLDREHNVTDYWVNNKSLISQSCNLTFTHYKFDDAGNLSKYEDENFVPNNSASDVVRYSPKTFIVDPQTKQKIRFNLRNKRDIQSIEYRSHVIVSCQDMNEDSGQNNISAEFASVEVKPILRHHIPLVVRPRNLEATLDIKNIILDKNQLTFDLVRSGTRSVYGQVNIKDQDNNLITTSRKFPLYHETLTKNVSISLPDFEADSLIVEFVEDDEVSKMITTSSILVIK